MLATSQPFRLKAYNGHHPCLEVKVSEVDAVGIFSIHPTWAIEGAFLVLPHVEGHEALDYLCLFNLHVCQFMLMVNKVR